jgi:hypothetical protein
MDFKQIAEEATEVLQSIFQKGSRFQAEKIGILVAYVILTIASVAWAMGGSNQDNELGANFRRDTLAQLEQQMFFIENTSGKTWTRVRIVINERYLYTVDRLPSGQQLSLKPEDLVDFYHLPRDWGRSHWEDLEGAEKALDRAPANLRPTYLQIRANQGRLDMEL